MSDNKNHTGTSMCGSIVYRNQKPMKETIGPFCYQCGHYKQGMCTGGDKPFVQEDMDTAQRCHLYTGKKRKPNQGYFRHKDKKGTYSYKKKKTNKANAHKKVSNKTKKNTKK